jgi:hypothetical protein
MLGFRLLRAGPSRIPWEGRSIHTTGIISVAAPNGRPKSPFAAGRKPKAITAQTPSTQSPKGPSITPPIEDGTALTLSNAVPASIISASDSTSERLQSTQPEFDSLPHSPAVLPSLHSLPSLTAPHTKAIEWPFHPVTEGPGVEERTIYARPYYRPRLFIYFATVSLLFLTGRVLMPNDDEWAKYEEQSADIK